MTNRGERKSLPNQIWGFLTSRRVTVVLLLTILVLLLLSLWLPQVPTDLDAGSQQEWWSIARERYGPRLDLYERLGLVNLFRTPTFLALLAALFLNLLACTVDRLGKLWRAATHHPTLRLPDPAYEGAHWQSEGLSLEQARCLLRRRRLRLQEETGSPHYFYGESFRWTPLGTLLTHLGLLFFALAALLHTQLAWREELVVDPGHAESPTTTQLQHRDCAIQSIDHQFTTAPTGLPRLQGLLQVTEVRGDGDTSITQGWTAPAAPFSACGAKFYLHSHGLELLVTVTDESGRWLSVSSSADSGDEQGATPARLRFLEGTTEVAFDIPNLDWHVTVVPSTETLGDPTDATFILQVALPSKEQYVFQGAFLQKDWLEIEINGVLLAIYADIFFVVEAVHDPGFPAFLAGGIALVLGGGLTLFFPRRRLWARLQEGGILQVRLGMEKARLDQEIESLDKALRLAGGGAR